MQWVPLRKETASMTWDMGECHTHSIEWKESYNSMDIKFKNRWKCSVELAVRPGALLLGGGW